MAHEIWILLEKKLLLELGEVRKRIDEAPDGDGKGGMHFPEVN